MKKSEAIEQGRAAGIARFAKLQSLGLLTITADFDEDAFKARIGEETSAYMADAKIRNNFYFDAFAQAFLAEARRTHQDLPEVKKEWREKLMRRKLKDTIESAQEVIDKFAARLAENPLDAFEWSDKAIDAAAQQHVALSVQRVFEHENGGYEKAVEHALSEALSGARYPSRSTSQPSNICKQAVTAAYAQLVEDVRWLA